MSDPAPLEVQFALGGAIFAVAAESVTKVLPLPAVALLPFQPPGLDGAAAVANTIVPLLTLPGKTHGGRDLILVRLDGNEYGLRADRVLRVTRRDPEASSAASVQWLDIATLVEAIGAVQMPASEILRSDAVPRITYPAASSITPGPPPSSALVVETADGICHLPLDCVVELFDTLPVVALPDPRPFLLGAAFHRDSFLPVLSLGLLRNASPRRECSSNGFVVVRAAEQICVLAVEKIIGLKHDADPTHLLNLSDLLDDILPASGTADPDGSPQETKAAAATRHLLIDYAGRSLAFRLDTVAHIHDRRPILGVPGSSDMMIAGVVALGSRILPVLNPGDVLGFPDCRHERQSLLELKLWQNETFAVPADRIRGIVSFADSELLRAPDGTPISALANIDATIVWILDPVMIAEAAGWRLHAA